MPKTGRLTKKSDEIKRSDTWNTLEKKGILPWLAIVEQGRDNEEKEGGSLYNEKILKGDDGDENAN